MAEIGRDINKALEYIRAGRVVAIPTETVYGLAANALNVKAVEQIFAIKERPISNPLIMHMSDKEMMLRYVTDVPERLDRLMEEYWPGPLTVLLDKSSAVPVEVNAGLDKVAVRVPQHPLTLGLIEKLDAPLAAPSANPFGYISPTSAQHVQDQLGSKIPYILDGGSTKVGLESTIVGLDGDHLVVYRLGGITLESLMATYDGVVKINNQKGHAPDAPGMLPYHYAPKTLITLIANLDELPRNNCKIGLICHSTSWNNEVTDHTIKLSYEDEFALAAKHLYDSMHQMDSLGLDHIYIEKFPNSGLGRTINDRLTRACKRRT